MKEKVRQYLVDGFNTNGMKKLARETKDPKDLLKILWSIIIENRYPYQWRASWLFEQIIDNKPEFAIEYFPFILHQIPEFNHPGQLRHCLKVILLTDIELWDFSEMLELGYGLMMNESLPPASRVHAMEITYRIVKVEPELKNEFIESLRLINIEGGAAIKSRVRKYNALLKKIPSN